MPRKKNDPPKSPGGRFASAGSEKKRRRGSGPSLSLTDGAKGKRGSKTKGEANQARAAAKPAKKMKSTWVPTSTQGSASGSLPALSVRRGVGVMQAHPPSSWSVRRLRLRRARRASFRRPLRTKRTILASGWGGAMAVQRGAR